MVMSCSILLSFALFSSLHAWGSDYRNGQRMQFNFDFTCSLRGTYEVRMTACEDDTTWFGIWGGGHCGREYIKDCQGTHCKASCDVFDKFSETGDNFECYIHITHTCTTDGKSVTVRHPKDDFHYIKKLSHDTSSQNDFSVNLDSY